MIKSVSYTRSYVIGAFLQEKIGVEIELAENQDPLEAILEAKKLTDTAHEQANPHLYNGIQPISEPTTLPTLKVEREQKPTSIEDQIKACTQLEGDDGLASFKQVAQRDQELMKLYMEQLKKITNGI
jgi:hypothetical protein